MVFNYVYTVCCSKCQRYRNYNSPMEIPTDICPFCGYSSFDFYMELTESGEDIYGATDNSCPFACPLEDLPNPTD